MSHNKCITLSLAILTPFPQSSFTIVPTVVLNLYKQMLIINNKLLPLGKDYVAINLFGIIFAKARLTADGLRHEKIHTYQQVEMLFLAFYLWYVLEWLIRLIQYRKPHQAYRNISFEREAYANQHISDYKNHRPHYAWIHYLLTKPT